MCSLLHAGTIGLGIATAFGLFKMYQKDPERVKEILTYIGIGGLVALWIAKLPSDVHVHKLHVTVSPETSGGVCFAVTNSSKVLMADGSRKPIGDLKVGDSVSSHALKSINETHDQVISTKVMSQKITRIVSEEVVNKQFINIGGVWLTRGHPFLNGKGQWTLPREAEGAPTALMTTQMINFVLQDGHNLIVNDLVCCTLGIFVGNRVQALTPHNAKRFGNQFKFKLI